MSRRFATRRKGKVVSCVSRSGMGKVMHSVTPAWSFDVSQRIGEVMPSEVSPRKSGGEPAEARAVHSSVARAVV